MGCTVFEADSGRTALAMLERNEPCDLMVVDLMMPGLSGTDTIRLARRTRPARRRCSSAATQTGLASRASGYDVVLKVAAVQAALHRDRDNVSDGNGTPCPHTWCSLRPSGTA